MISLTPRQADLLRFIQGYQEAHGGVSPSCDEMSRALGCKARSGHVFGMLLGLEERGHISRLPNRVRAIEILSPISIPRSPEGEPLYAVPGVGG